MYWMHNHIFELPCLETGACVKRCYENSDGELWVSDDSKASRVNFCPACGYDAPKKVDPIYERTEYPKEKGERVYIEMGSVGGFRFLKSDGTIGCLKDGETIKMDDILERNER